ncbi:MAG: phage protease [Luteolibacter sp.]
MNTPILNRENQPPSDGWYQIEVKGEHPAGDKRVQVIDEAALQAIVNRFKADAAAENFPGLLVDADHLSHDLENPTAALAWVKELDIRNGQLHARLDLTDLGEQAITGNRYKFFSTEYSSADLENLGNGRVRPLRLSGLAFTNRPNNKGGKPISNREADDAGETPALLSNRDGTLPPGETTTETTNTTKPMTSIAEKLGLSAEATEADILNRIDTLQGDVAAAKKKDQEAEADAVLNRLGDRVPEAVRPQWREQLITNRESAEKLMEASFPEKPAAKPEPRIFNRADANPEVANTTHQLPADEKARKQNALVASIRNRERCNFETAWTMAKSESPELFN